jgi:hypothetical protein
MYHPTKTVTDRSWVFSSPAKEATLKPLCQRVEAEFDLPAGRLCRYFADFDDPSLIANPRFGQHFRGFHATVAARNSFPKYLFDCFFHPLEMFTMRERSPSFEEMVAFDTLIYVRQSTCDDPTGLVECYAHELQHFVQRSRTPRLHAVNGVLYENLKSLEPTTTVMDIPTEREANIVSKRVAESVCGAEAVRAFADTQVRLMEQCGEHEQRDRWICFRDTPSSTPFDLLEATLPLVRKHKAALDFRIDVDADTWWVGPLPEDKTDEAA